MSRENIDRIRGDLAAIKQAAGLELPFGPDDVRANLWGAACGALLAIWAALAPWDYRGVVALPLALAVAAAARCSLLARRNRATRPAAWREHRLAMLAALIVLVAAVAYCQWE